MRGRRRRRLRGKSEIDLSLRVTPVLCLLEKIDGLIVPPTPLPPPLPCPSPPVLDRNIPPYLRHSYSQKLGLGMLVIFFHLFTFIEFA